VGGGRGLEVRRGRRVDLLDLGNKPVPHFGYGFQEARFFGAVPERAAKLRDALGEGVIGDGDARPEPFHQLLASHQAVAVLDEPAQDLERLRRQADDAIGSAEDGTGNVNLKFPNAIDRPLRSGSHDEVGKKSGFGRYSAGGSSAESADGGWMKFIRTVRVTQVRTEVVAVPVVGDRRCPRCGHLLGELPESHDPETAGNADAEERDS
jgi:hypothetical protein